MGAAYTACTFQLGKATGLASNLPLLGLYRIALLARHFDRAHPQAHGAPVLSETTTFTPLESLREDQLLSGLQRR